MLRTISLTLLMLLSVGALLPFAGSSAHGLRQSFSAKRNHRQYRRHSRAWWRRYRARLRRRQAAALAYSKSNLTPLPARPVGTSPVSMALTPQLPSGLKGVDAAKTSETKFRAETGGTVSVQTAALVNRKSTLAPTLPVSVGTSPVSMAVRPRLVFGLKSVNGAKTSETKVRTETGATVSRPAAALAHRKSTLAPTLPVPMGTSPVSTAVTPMLPSGWKSVNGGKPSEIKFRTETGATVSGQAALAVVAQSRPNPGYLSAREERRLLAGVAIADLRRIVIDRMITSGGWVTNDFYRDVAGQRVFIVTAQTPSEGREPEKWWNFYFTEVNGRIYSLTTNTPPQFSSRMAAEAESFIASLHAASKPVNR